MRGYYYVSDGDGGGGVGTRTTHFSSPKDNVGIDRHDGGFKTSHCR